MSQINGRFDICILKKFMHKYRFKGTIIINYVLNIIIINCLLVVKPTVINLTMVWSYKIIFIV